MRTTARALALSVALGAACVQASDYPDWLASVIAELESEPVANPPSLIASYEYKGQTVYYLPPRCCDVPSTVYGSTGTVLCSADGGLTGRGDGRCADFFAERKNERIIWRDKRRTP
ncbi:MAG: hypothetical protein Q8K82_09605 [Gemmatimonadaceae bacterium]|nr:hypothetical protein [Gemmatimonadaceae bacterium]